MPYTLRNIMEAGVLPHKTYKFLHLVLKFLSSHLFLGYSSYPIRFIVINSVLLEKMEHRRLNPREKEWACQRMHLTVCLGKLFGAIFLNENSLHLTFGHQDDVWVFLPTYTWRITDQLKKYWLIIKKWCHPKCNKYWITNGWNKKNN